MIERSGVRVPQERRESFLLQGQLFVALQQHVDLGHSAKGARNRLQPKTHAPYGGGGEVLLNVLRCHLTY